MKKIILLAAVLWFGAAALFGQGIEGSWRGTLDLGAHKLRIVFNIAAEGDGFVTTMDSPDQGARGIPVKETSFDGSSLKISAPELGMTYEGKLYENILRGIFRQSGLTVRLDLERREPEPPRRPQNPAQPYPYNSEEIVFENAEAGIKLAGTFTYPAKGRKFPAVVLISGSGPENRDEEVFGHKPFLVLSDHLTRNGIAVLRFDDRGTAGSEGNYHAAAIQDFATDVSAAMDYLKTRKEVNHKKIGLLGHSEGGQIAFIVAGKRSDVDFIVTLAGPGVKGADLLREQRRSIGLAQGVAQEAIDGNEELIVLMQRTLEKYGAENVRENLDRLTEELMAQIPDDYPILADVIEKAARRDFPAIASPEIRSLTEYDPAADLAVIKAPILAIFGEKDLQVPADMNMEGLRKRFSGDLTAKKYPNLNHLFQHAVTGLSAEYGQIEETMSPEVMRDIAAWILAKTK